MTNSTIPDFDEHLQRMASRDSLTREIAFQQLRPYAPQFAEELVRAFRAATNRDQQYLLFVLLIESLSPLTKPIFDEVAAGDDMRLKRTLYQFDPSYKPPEEPSYFDRRQIVRRLFVWGLATAVFVFLRRVFEQNFGIPSTSVPLLLMFWMAEEIAVLIKPGFLLSTMAGRDLSRRDRGVMAVTYFILGVAVAIGWLPPFDWIRFVLAIIVALISAWGIGIVFGSQRLRNELMPKRFRK